MYSFSVDSFSNTRIRKSTKEESNTNPRMNFPLIRFFRSYFPFSLSALQLTHIILDCDSWNPILYFCRDIRVRTSTVSGTVHLTAISHDYDSQLTYENTFQGFNDLVKVKVSISYSLALKLVDSLQGQTKRLTGSFMTKSQY